MDFELPELDRKATQQAVENSLAKYRMFKYLAYEEREATTTPAYVERMHGPTNETSDQTAMIAVHNAEEQRKRRSYCERIEKAVKRLPPMERFLIQERYMVEDADYTTDHKVYSFKFQPPISQGTYTKIRWKAFYKLALGLNIETVRRKER
jgi:ArpU family phage transcriptional regulator